MGSKRPFEALVNSGNVSLSKTGKVKRRNIRYRRVGTLQKELNINIDIESI